MLYQLSYAPELVGPELVGPELVGQGGLEPPTPRLSSVCSNQLSYWPDGSIITGRDMLTAPGGPDTRPQARPR